MHEASDGSREIAPKRLCVFTILTGQYERLNEQPMAAQSGMPFICLTDNPRLESQSWQIRQVQPLFDMDSIRSQRDIKIRPQVYLPDYDASLYIDNSIQLAQPPEEVIKRYFPASGFWLPRHSYRASVLDEFLEVAKIGLGDPDRIFEQLHHYAIQAPRVLSERPYWTAVLLRDHRNPAVRAMQDFWTAQVQRYSRRDQLSINLAFHRTGLAPECQDIDNFVSWFHTWPHIVDRDTKKRMGYAASSHHCLMRQVRELRALLVDLVGQQDCNPVGQTSTQNEDRAALTREREVLIASLDARLAKLALQAPGLPKRVERFLRHRLKRLLGGGISV